MRNQSKPKKLVPLAKFHAFAKSAVLAVQLKEQIINEQKSKLQFQEFKLKTDEWKTGISK